MQDKLAKLMAKKKGKPMDDLERQAKMNVVKELGCSAADAMKGRLAGLKKVTVASDSKEGLAKGLEKAEEMISPEGKEESEEMGEDMAEDAMDGEGRSGDLFGGSADSEEMSEDEIDQKLAELMAKKQRLEAKKA